VNAIQQTLLDNLPAKRKTTPSGWTSFNAPCCTHRGHSPDTRGRGGVINAADGSVSYHCFNCNFKATWRPGWHFNFKFRRLLLWFGVEQNDTQRLVFEAMRIREELGDAVEEIEQQQEKIEFEAKPLPEESADISQVATLMALDPNYETTQSFRDIVAYAVTRKIDIQRYPIFYSTSRNMNMDRRVVIPFTWEGKTIGYTARALDNHIKPKYFSSYDSNYVFNTDQQPKDAKFVIVCEGPFDAMAVDGVAILSNNINETQAEIIERLGKRVIVVPDFDRSGQRMIQDAIIYDWEVSFPTWSETCKDIGEAVQKYGKLFVVKNILDNAQASKLKINLMRKAIK